MDAEQCEKRRALMELHMAREGVLHGGKMLECLPGLVAKIINEKMWRYVEPRGRDPFKSFYDFATWRLPDGLGAPMDRLLRICQEHQEATDLLRREMPPLAGHGINQHNERHAGVDNIKSSEQGGTSSTYLIARLARDQPELLEQIGPDKPYKSARAAAIAAGIVKVPTPLDQGKKAFNRMDDESRCEFAKWILCWLESPES